MLMFGQTTTLVHIVVQIFLKSVAKLWLSLTNLQ